MERKTISYELEWFKMGFRQVKDFQISFVSNKTVREYNKYISDVQAVHELSIKLSDLVQKSKALPNDVKIKSDIASIEKEIREKASEDFFKRRFEIIYLILECNGYEKEEPFNDIKFWDNKVDPNTINDFITKCILKDVDKKQGKEQAAVS